MPRQLIPLSKHRDARFAREPLVAATVTDHPAGRWVYVVAMNAWRGGGRQEWELPLAELGDVAPRDPVVAYDWKSGEAVRVEPGGSLPFALDPEGWSLRVLCPLLPGDVALFGDVSRYASVGDRRLHRVRLEGGALAFDVLGRPGESVEVRGSAAEPFRAAECRAPASGAAALAVRRGDGGRWSATVAIPAAGWCDVRLSLP